MPSRTRRAYLAVGLCAAGSSSLRTTCTAFSGVVTPRPTTGAAFRPDLSGAALSRRVCGAVARPRTTWLASTVDVEPTRGVAERTWNDVELLPSRFAESDVGLLDPADPAETGDFTTTTEQLRPKKRKGKDPELLEGDMLVNTPKMAALVYSSLGLNALYSLQAISTITSPWQAVCTILGGLVGYVIADLVSGVFHWSVDNYGNGDTPVFGYVIEAFQGHHASPWTITHRPFENNVHKIAYAVLPLLALLRLANPGPAGVMLGVTFLVGSLMSQEFHRFAHMLDPPAVAKTLQDWGLLVSRKEHGRHHLSPFEEKYCIVSGWCNGPLDHFRVFRFMERVVYQLNGVEPIAWKLDPSVKEEAMGTGWLPFTNGS